jgi:hypothetical protein
MQAILNRVKYPSRFYATKVWVAMLVALTLCFCATVASAQWPPVVMTATTTLYAQSSVAPGRVAVDKAGNVFFQNESNAGGPTELYEIPYAAPAATATAPIMLITGLGLYKSEGVFVDPNGNLWVTGGPGFPGTTPPGGSSENIGLVEIPALNGIPNTAAIPAGGETVDQVAANNCTATSTAPCVWQNNSYGGSFANYYIQAGDVFVDGAGNVYLVDIYDNTSNGGYNRIVSFNVNNPSVAKLWADNLPSNNSAQLTLGSDGNIYYADSYIGNWGGGGATGNVYQIGAPYGTILGAVTQVGTMATFASAEITAANGISSDSYGNLYIVGTNSTGTEQLSEVPFESGMYNFGYEFGIVSGLNGNSTSYGGSSDAWGNYYTANGNQVVQIQVGGYNFGSVNVGSQTTASSTVPAPTLNLYFNANETVTANGFPTGSPASNTYAALLQSFPSDITTAPFSGSFTPGQTASVVADFQPIHPGLLKGSYVLNMGGSTSPILTPSSVLTFNLQGVGVGPQPIFLPGVASSLFTSAATSSTVAASINLNRPSGIAVDTFGDIFVADSGNGRVVADCLASTATAAANSFCANTGYAGAVVGLGGSFTTPSGIALDGANNLYVVDSTANTVTIIFSDESQPNNSPLVFDSLFGYVALNGPTGIALDGYANIYIADTGNNRIVEAHQFGASTNANTGSATDNVVYVSSTTTFGGTALSGPTGLAVDAAGDLFIADTGNNRIVEYSALGATSVVTTTGVTLSAPTGVSVLPSGSLVVTDSTNGVSLIAGGTGSALSFDNTSTGTPLLVGKTVGVALDLSGNIYATDALNNNVVELNVSSPTMAPMFPSTNDGTNSAISDTTDVFNSGNATLTFAAAPMLDTGDTNFEILGTSTCTATTTLTEGQTCNVVTDFTPGATATLGLLSGMVTLTDNQLGYALLATTPNETAGFGTGTNGTQTIALNGTAASVAAQTITFGTIPAQTVGTPLTLSASASSGLTVTFTSTTTSICTVSGTKATLLAAGTCTIQAMQDGNAGYAAATPVPQSFTVNGETQTITFGAIPTQTVGTPLTLTATASSGLTVTFTSTTTSVCTVSSTTVTFLTAGTCTIDADQAGNSTYAAATTVPQNITVNPAPTAQTITFGAIPTQMSGTPLTLSATATSGLAVTFTSTTPSVCTVSNTTATLLTAGTCTIDANQAGGTSGVVTYAAATMVPQSFTVNQAPSAQTITFGAIAAQTVGIPLTLSASASSGLAVTYTSTTPSVCTVSSTTASFVTPGTCTIDANQAGGTSGGVTYLAAAMVSQSFTVNAVPIAQSIIFSDIATQTVGTPLTLSATATSGLAVTFTSTTTSICTVSNTTATFVAAGACIIDANQGGGISGGVNYAAASLVSQSFTVNASNAVLYTVTPSVTSLTITAGQSSSPITIAVAPASGFSGMVTFACSGLPTGATCSFSPASITLPGTTSTQLTISTTSASAAVRPNSSPLFPGATLAVALCCLFSFRKRRALQMFALLTVSVIGLGLFTGCGGSSQSTVSKVVVTATSGTAQETTSIALTVN